MTNELDKLIAAEVEKFKAEFVATGADIEGMKRVEYRNFREGQVDSMMKHLDSSLRSFAEKLRAAVEVDIQDYRNWCVDEKQRALDVNQVMLAYDMDSRFIAAKQILAKVKARWDKLLNS